MTSVKSTRTNEYRITIDMETNLSSLLLDKEQIPYPQSQSYCDELTIKENRIEIIAKRSGIVDLKGVFLNHQSATVSSNYEITSVLLLCNEKTDTN